MLAHHSAKQAIESLNHGVRIKHRRLHDLLATDGKNLTREVGAAHRQGANLTHVATHRIVGRHYAEREVAVAQHAGEQVAEVV